MGHCVDRPLNQPRHPEHVCAIARHTAAALAAPWRSVPPAQRVSLAFCCFCPPNTAIPSGIALTAAAMHLVPV